MDQFQTYFKQGLDICLYDVPQTLYQPTVTRCGNGIVKDGEECDCGKASSVVGFCGLNSAHFMSFHVIKNRPPSSSFDYFLLKIKVTAFKNSYPESSDPPFPHCRLN